jgi:type I restriction enzyme S subunit
MLHSIVTGSAQPKFNKTNFKDMVVPVPPIEVQRRIGELLKSFDDKIENNNRINRNLEEQAQALFKSWFVDFEPWGGSMPEDWKEYQLTEFAEIISGYSYKGAELLPSEDAMATIKNFDRKGYFKLDGYKEIQISGRLKNTQILNLFDVIVAHTDITQQADIIGNPAIILSKGGYRNIIMSMDLCKVQPTHYAISSAFLYCLLKDIRFKSHALGYVNGTTVLHLSKKALPEYRVFLPNDLSKVQELGDRLQNLYKRYSINLEESQRLAALRDTLLPKLMKGEIAL